MPVASPLKDIDAVCEAVPVPHMCSFKPTLDEAEVGNSPKVGRLLGVPFDAGDGK